MLLYIAMGRSFLVAVSISLCYSIVFQDFAIIYLFILLLMDVWAVSSFFYYEQSFYKHYFTRSWLTLTRKKKNYKTVHTMISFIYSTKYGTIMHGIKVRVLVAS